MSILLFNSWIELVELKQMKFGCLRFGHYPNGPKSEANFSKEKRKQWNVNSSFQGQNNGTFVDEKKEHERGLDD